MTHDDLTAIAASLAPMIRDYVATAIADLRERQVILETKQLTPPADPTIGTLRERVAVLETRAPVPGPAGADGTAGADGFGFDDLAVTYDGDRTITLAFTRDGHTKAFPIVVPWLRYQGVYQDQKLYAPGDVVTCGGSAWHCHAVTGAKPGEGSSDWQLMVKRGQQGSQGIPGRDAYPAPVVKAG